MAKYFYVNNSKWPEFSSDIDSRTNTIYVHSIHPYDETDYHWARQSENGQKWNVYRSGRLVRNFSGDLSEEDIAECLLQLDKENNLKRTGGIW